MSYIISYGSLPPISTDPFMECLLSGSVHLVRKHLNSVLTIGLFSCQLYPLRVFHDLQRLNFFFMKSRGRSDCFSVPLTSELFHILRLYFSSGIFGD